MSHHRYQTKALILGNTLIGESNRFIDVFTEDLGRIRAVARSVREERSKLRFSLQDFSVLGISLVRGKEVWRIVGARNDFNFYYELIERKEERDAMVRLLFLLRRLLNGEEENKDLFRVITKALSFLREHSLNKEQLNTFECLTALRVLYNLGYVAKDTKNERFLLNADVNIDVMSYVSPIRLEMVKQINTSLQESQL